MNINGINLVGNLVWNARQRRTIYRAMLGYLLVACVLLVFTAGRAALAVREGLDLNRQAQVLQQRFKTRHPEQSGMEAYAGRLKEQLEKKTAQADSINAVQPATLCSIIPLLNLLADPVQGGRVNKLSFAQQGNEGGRPELNFSVTIPANLSGDNAEVLAFLKQWRNNPVLFREFSSISSTTTERGNVAGTPVSIRKYKAVFRE